MGFARLGGLRGRGLGVYFKNGSPVGTAAYGDTITYNVSGQPPGQIWLEQYVNGVLGYNGPFTIPMAPYTLSAKDQAGTWVSMAYSLIGGAKSALLETATFQVTTTPTAAAPPPSIMMDASCVGYAPGQVKSIRTSLNDPNWLPPGCGVVQGSVPTGTVPIGPGPGPSVVTISNAPSIPGALPPGNVVGASYNNNVVCMTGTYRFILATDGGYATGSNRAGCSQTNSANCDPQFFTDLQTAIDYANSNGEVPYSVDTSQEPWDLIACKIAIDPAKIYDPRGVLHGSGTQWILIAAGAAALYFLSRRGHSA
jgi:hypothetical protein